jgi:hypothetical protein
MQAEIRIFERYILSSGGKTQVSVRILNFPVTVDIIYK